MIEGFWYDLQMKTREQNKTKKTIGNRAIWLIYRTCWFWLIKRTLGWKNFVPEKFLEINRYFCWRRTATRLADRTMPSLHIRVFFGGKTKSRWSFHPLAYKTNNEHLRKLFQGHTKIVLSIIWFTWRFLYFSFSGFIHLVWILPDGGMGHRETPKLSQRI